MDLCGYDCTSTCFDEVDDRIHDLEDQNMDNMITPESIQLHGAPVATMKIVKHTGDVSRVAISPNNKFFVLSSEDNTASAWDAISGKMLFTLRGHTDDIRSVKISPDNSFIITVSNDTTAIRWDAQTGKRLNTYGVGKLIFIIFTSIIIFHHYYRQRHFSPLNNDLF